jgi:hypothetical protein
MPALSIRRCAVRNLSCLNFSLPKEILELKVTAQSRLLAVRTIDASSVRRWAKKYKDGETGRADLCDNEVDDL